MSRWTRVLIISFSFLLALFSLTLLMMFLSDLIMSAMMTLLLRLFKLALWRSLLLATFTLIFIASVASLMMGIVSGRLRRARVRESTIGTIDIGVDAIESIALNAAKSSQSGVKAAKARVAPFQGDKLRVHMSIMAYSDVELPAMMTRVQERVKKDIERYTGIEVSDVMVRVTRVDAIAARVDR